MSYQFNMAFTTVDDKASAYSLCQQTVSTLCEQEIAVKYAIEKYKQTRWFILGRRWPDPEKLDLWVTSIFEMSFVYWEHHNLLALVWSYPEEVSKRFGPSIFFQDSIDQNYAFDVWDDNIPIFNEVKASVARLSKEDVFALIGCSASNQNPAKEEYWRKTLVYRKILQALDLENWIYGRAGRFERIRMTGLNCMEKELLVQEQVRNAIEANFLKEV